MTPTPVTAVIFFLADPATSHLIGNPAASEPPVMTKEDAAAEDAPVEEKKEEAPAEKAKEESAEDSGEKAKEE